MEQQLIVQMVIGWLSSIFIQFLKRVKALPWITEHTEGVNRIVAAVVALFASIGIGFEFNKDAGTLLITGLTLTTVLTMGWNWLVQFFLQHVLYRISVKSVPVKVELPPITINPPAPTINDFVKPVARPEGN